MKRWELETYYDERDGGLRRGLVESPVGEYVAYDDHLAAREAWIAKAAELAGNQARQALELGMDLGRRQAEIGPEAFAREMEQCMEVLTGFAAAFARPA